MAFDLMVKEITRLSQDEGLNDGEIAEILGCSRATVNRTRIAHDIPKCNLHNRKDKTYVCNHCKKTVTIRRRERRKLLCNECEAAVNEKKNEDMYNLSI